MHAEKDLVQEHTYKCYPPRRALDDVSIRGLGLVTAGACALDLERITRNVWQRHHIWPELEVVDVDSPEACGDEREVVSAVILMNVYEHVKTDGFTRPKRIIVTKPGLKKRRVEAGQPEATTGDVDLIDILSEGSEEDGAIREDSISDRAAAASFPPVHSEDHTVEIIPTHLPPESDIPDSDLPSPAGGSSAPPDGYDVYWDLPTPADQLVSPGGLAMGCPSVAVWERRHWIFSKFDSGIQMDSSAWYEVTPEAYALKVATNLRKILEQDTLAKASDGELKIADCRPLMAACSGVGGDAIALARIFPDSHKIVCVDSEPAKCASLRHNAELYEVANRLQIVTADIVEYAQSIAKKEVIEKRVEHITNAPMVNGGKVIGHMTFKTDRRVYERPFSWAILSPPWGGPTYRKCYSYFMSDQTFADLIKMVQACMTVADNLCLVLPRTQDISELIHLCAHGAPDLERFNYLQVHRMTENNDGYSFLTIAYMSRRLPLPSRMYPTEADLESVYDSAIAKRQKNLRSVGSVDLTKILEGMKNTMRKPLPNLEVDRSILVEKFKTDRELYKSVPGALRKSCANTIENAVFVKFLLNWLEEPVNQIGGSQYCFDIIGVDQTLNLVAETIRVWRAGGLDTADGTDKRTKGGVFFQILKVWYPVACKELRKYRKKYIELTTLNP